VKLEKAIRLMIREKEMSIKTIAEIEGILAKRVTRSMSNAR